MRDCPLPDRELLESLSDEELILATLLGRMDAFDVLARRYRRAVTLVAEGVLGSREAAEDVAQDTFILAFKALAQLQDPARFPAWLCAIARHRARRIASRASRDEPTEASELDRLILRSVSDEAMSPEQQFFQAVEREMVRTLLEQIPVEYRTVLELYHYQDWPVARIAGFLSLPITTIKWRLRYGRELMRRQLRTQSEGEIHGPDKREHRVQKQQRKRGSRRRQPGPQARTPDAAGHHQHRTGGIHDGGVPARRQELCPAV